MSYLSSLGESTQEMQWKRFTEHKVQLLQNCNLHGPDLGLGVCVVCHVDEIVNCRHVHLLVLGGHKHGRNTDQLQLHLGHVHSHQVGVYDLHTQIHGLLEEMKLQVHLNQPIDQH